jgi:glycosyltransferase involved in cell wall biosynthesis
MFSDAKELASQLRFVASNAAAATEMAMAGRRYVVENYTWPSVLDRMEASLHAAFVTAPS